MIDATIYLWRLACDPCRIAIGHRYTVTPKDADDGVRFSPVAVIHEDDFHDTFGDTPKLTKTPAKFRVTIERSES